MKKLLTFAVALLLSGTLIFAANSNTNQNATGVERYAIYIGANYGGKGREKLLYAGSDAMSFQKTMAEIGGIPEKNSWLLIDPTKESVEEAIESISATIEKKNNLSKRSEFIFYYSGHSTEDELLLGDDKYDYSSLKAAITAVPSDVHVVILDSCYSGNFIRTKGGQKKKPFLMDDSAVVKGHAYLSSSSEKESSQESDEIESSYFTNAMITGLRGAADTSGDNKVSLNELYSYAFNDTLSKTEDTDAGPQHPNYNITLVGSGDLILSDISEAEATVVIAKEAEGRFIIRDARGKLISEINKVKGTPITMALSAGNYSVVVITDTSTKQGNFVLAFGDTFIIEENNMQKVNRKETKSRGGRKILNKELLSEEDTDEDEEYEDEEEYIEEDEDFLPFIPFEEEKTSADTSMYDKDGFINFDNEDSTDKDSKESNAKHLQAATVQEETTSENKDDNEFLSFDKKDEQNVSEVKDNDDVKFFNDSIRTPSYILKEMLAYGFFPVHFSFTSGLSFLGSEKTTSFVSLGLISAKDRNVFGIQQSFLINNVNKYMLGVQAAGITNNAYYGEGFQYAGITNNAVKFTGMQAAGIYNHADYITGFQAAGIINTSKKLSGIQAVGIYERTDTLKGIQLAGLINNADTVYGMQVSGLMNFGKDVCGIQASDFLNTSKTVKGAQFSGYINWAESVEGAQFSGFLNYAGKVKGLQIGLINFAKENDGIAIGLFNWIGNGVHDGGVYIDTDQTATLQFQSGTNTLFSTFGISGPVDTPDTLFVGLGTREKFGKHFSIDLEVLFKIATSTPEYITDFAEETYSKYNTLEKLIKFNDDDWERMQAFGEEIKTFEIPSVRTTLNFDFNRFISFFVNASVDIGVSSWNDNAFLAHDRRWSQRIDLNDSDYLTLYPSFGVGMKIR